MKFNHILYALILSISIFSLASCKKQVEIGPPVTLLATNNVFTDNGTATAAQLSIYAQLGNGQKTLAYLHFQTGLSSDEFYTYLTDQTSKDLYANSLSAADGNAQITFYYWVPFYNYIYRENAVLENLNISGNLAPKVKKQLTAEAQFMRAYCYFNLINLYGDVPLATTTNYQVNAALARTPKVQVYQQIVQDLLDAQSNLSTKFVDASDTTLTTERIRPTAWAADALLARTYLCMGSGFYDKAEAAATLVINNSALFSLPTDLNTVFKKNSTETVWQIPTYSGTTLAFTGDGNNFVLTSPPSPSTNGFAATISAQLTNAFENGDQRKAKWIGTYTNGTSSWNYPAKYKDNSITASTPSEYTMILRLAEQYLIRSEARAQQGNVSGALSDLNTIRNRAGLANYSGATDQASVIAAISHERQVELFAEGDRWFNLKRTGTVDAVMTIITPQKSPGTSWHSYQQLYPLDPNELLINANLTQAPGY